MSAEPNKFEITINRTTYQVTGSLANENIYHITTENVSYCIARDFYGVWVELTSSKGAAHIPLSQIGQLIESHITA